MQGKAKYCSRCKTEKPLDEFHKGSGAKGRATWCKPCQNAYAKEYYASRREELKARVAKAYSDPRKRAERLEYQRNYNLANRRKVKHCQLQAKFGKSFGIEQYEQLLEEQNGVCAICGQNRHNGKAKALCVDHDHETGEIRGLLCQFCNRGLGFLGDTREAIDRASVYLKRKRKRKLLNDYRQASF